MSLTVSDAVHVNTVVNYLLALDDDQDPPATDDQVIDALAQLADKAHARLGAGVTGVTVRATWASFGARR